MNMRLLPLLALLISLLSCCTPHYAVLVVSRSPYQHQLRSAEPPPLRPQLVPLHQGRAQVQPLDKVPGQHRVRLLHGRALVHQRTAPSTSQQHSLPQVRRLPEPAPVSPADTAHLRRYRLGMLAAKADYARDQHRRVRPEWMVSDSVRKAVQAFPDYQEGYKRVASPVDTAHLRRYRLGMLAAKADYARAHHRRMSPKEAVSDAVRQALASFPDYQDGYKRQSFNSKDAEMTPVYIMLGILGGILLCWLALLAIGAILDPFAGLLLMGSP